MTTCPPALPLPPNQSRHQPLRHPAPPLPALPTLLHPQPNKKGYPTPTRTLASRWSWTAPTSGAPLAWWASPRKPSSTGSCRLRRSARAPGATPGRRRRDGRAVHFRQAQKNFAYVCTAVDRYPLRSGLDGEPERARPTRCSRWRIRQRLCSHATTSATATRPTAPCVPTGPARVAPGKSETYSVEGDNADLRHYLARLGARAGVSAAAWWRWHDRSSCLCSVTMRGSCSCGDSETKSSPG